jgi:hypothetical protein
VLADAFADPDDRTPKNEWFCEPNGLAFSCPFVESFGADSAFATTKTVEREELTRFASEVADEVEDGSAKYMKLLVPLNSSAPKPFLTPVLRVGPTSKLSLKCLLLALFSNRLVMPSGATNDPPSRELKSVLWSLASNQLTSPEIAAGLVNGLE